MARLHDGARTSRGIIGFHGVGRGSMASVEAVSSEGFTLANLCETTADPPVAEVYRTARTVLAQPDLVGYFGCGGGEASRSAYGLAKAFVELNLSIPAVVRFGGNGEHRAVEILHDACRGLPAVVEGYGQDEPPAFCAGRFAALVEASDGASAPMTRRIPAFVGRDDAFSCPVRGGRLWIDHAACDAATAAAVVELGQDLLALDRNGRPVPVVAEALADTDSGLIACEIECRRRGSPVVFVDLPVPPLDGPQ